eukprot:TRINITY_DN7126_c0_g1_i7.p1 TRINITY_DN7126_c0_g1~~TRINITY_DN7126_c0_g1_i7.p1  ORF type:complete len:845 (-),score=168.11 TRINITY_DN7126_c0_g1_i7:738-3128(-)
MVSLLCNSTAIRLPKPHFSPKPDHAPRPTPRFCTRRARHPPSITAAASGTGSSSNAEPPKRPLLSQQQMRTLFPGGFKRPEIKVPTLVLQLDSDEVLRSEDALDAVDVAVSKWAGIVVLDAGEGSGGRLYEAARALKSVIGERAYLLIAERVDVAAAVGAGGVVLSDQGLPAIVARNMMMESKTESVVLPLVGRTVQTANSALIASNSEGADFLILAMDRDRYAEVLGNSAYRHVKVPIFTMIASLGEGPLFAAATKSLQSGASGLVISLEDIKLFRDDTLDQLLTGYKMNRLMQSELQISNNHEMNLNDGFNGRNGVSGFTKIEDKEKQFIEVEKLVLLEAIAVIRKAAPLMEEVSLLVDAVSRLDDPFLLVIVGEFNSGKSTVINALLGRRYLKEGVIPTTNEITLLCYSEMDYSGQQRCERRPDGQYICYLPAPILKQMNLVDTPGTNVILQRQQRLTEEFVPRADLLFLVISADRPLTESEVSFLRYVQQWKKRVVFVLNKSDLYQNNSELEEATAFIKENVQKLLNTEQVILFPVSARSALKAKLSASLNVEKSYEELLSNDPRWKTSGFHELETFLFSFLDGSTETGIERMRLKLETPIGITDRLLSACDTLVRQECEYARQDLISVKEIISSVKEYAMKIERESHSWRKQTFSLIKTAQARAVKLTESTLQLSNIDLVASYFFKGEKSGSMPATLSIQNEIISPALSGVQRLLGEYLTWLHSSNACEGKRIKETFEKRWPTFVNSRHQVHSEAYELMGKGDEVSLQVVTNFSPSAAAKLFEQEVREVHS